MVGGGHLGRWCNARLFRRAALGVAAGGLVSVSLVAGSVPLAGATTAPSPLDLIAQVGAVVNAQSATEAQLLSIDAQIRNALNGTTAGYVYNLASDAIQAVTGPLKDLVTGVKNATKHLAAAHTRTATMRTWWTRERTAYLEMQTNSSRAPRWSCWFTTPPPPGPNTACLAARAAISTDFNRLPTAVLAATPPPPAANVGVEPNGVLARKEYAAPYSSIEDVASAALETLTAARAIVGDAKDYPSNKLFEAILQGLGEHRLTTALGKVVADKLPLEKGIQNVMTTIAKTCMGTAQTMVDYAFAGWGNVAPGPTSPPAPTKCP